jgi:hypothetical protein
MLDRTVQRRPSEIIEALAGLNAQTKRGPIVGLWTRSREYVHSAYLDELRRYELVRANLMRGTIHVVTRRQYLAWRKCLQPLAERVVGQFCPGIWRSTDHDALIEAGRELLLFSPGLTRSEIGSRLSKRFPLSDPKQLGFAVRLLLPVVEQADGDPWNSSRTAYVLADTVLGSDYLSSEDGAVDMARSYLMAFGPATPGDFGYWSGIAGARSVFSRLAALQCVGEHEYDIPPLRDSDSRRAFVLPEFDNLFFCRKSEAGIRAAKARLIYPPAKMHGSLMFAGRVVGQWSTERGKLSLSMWTDVDGCCRQEWDSFERWYRLMA